MASKKLEFLSYLTVKTTS